MISAMIGTATTIRANVMMSFMLCPPRWAKLWRNSGANINLRKIRNLPGGYLRVDARQIMTGVSQLSLADESARGFLRRPECIA